MLVYQQSDRMYFANQAHNHYLQLASEGGLLLVAPVVLVILAFAALFRRRLAADTSDWCWLRIGAGAGLVGVGVQSVWETGLRMPGNAMLFAVLAAIAVHSSADPASPRPSR
jgi:O-antigen ligase